MYIEYAIKYYDSSSVDDHLCCRWIIIVKESELVPVMNEAIVAVTIASAARVALQRY